MLCWHVSGLPQVAPNLGVPKLGVPKLGEPN